MRGRTPEDYVIGNWLADTPREALPAVLEGLQASVHPDDYKRMCTAGLREIRKRLKKLAKVRAAKVRELERRLAACVPGGHA